MASTSNFSVYWSNVISVAQRYKVPFLTVAALPLIRLAYIDYRDWYALGRGGIPHNVFGWIIQCGLRLVAARDVRSTGCYDSLKTSELEQKGFLEADIPKRSKPPSTGSFVVPHRQIEETASDTLKEVGQNFSCYHKHGKLFLCVLQVVLQKLSELVRVFKDLARPK